MSRARQPADVHTARDREVLDFAAERDADSTSWRRADPRTALIERWGRYGYLVTLPDGNAHFCALAQRRDGSCFGFCKCKGFGYHDGPCAHLSTIRKAAVVGMEAVNGERVEIAHAAEVNDLADAEHTAAQQSGEVFQGDARAGDSAPDHATDLDRLTDAQREVYLAVRERGLEPHEVAGETDRTPSTARSLLHQARKRLAEA